MIKKIFHGLVAFFFVTSLLLLLILGSVSLVFGSPQTIKSAVESSGLYENAVDTALVSVEQELSKNPNGQEQGSIDLSQPAIQQAAKKALPPETLQTSVESVVDGFISWLDGTSDTFTFSVDLTKSKQTFISEVGNYAEQRYAGLQPCDQAQLAAIRANPDPLTIPCQVAGLDIAQAKTDLTESLRGDELLADPVITEKSFAGEQGESLFKNTEQVQAAYGVLKMLPAILLAATVVFGIATAALHINLRKGIKQVAIILTSVGGIFGVGSLILLWAASGVRASVDQSAQQEVLGTITAGLVSSLVNALGLQMLILSGISIVIGAVILIALAVFKSPPEPGQLEGNKPALT